MTLPPLHSVSPNIKNCDGEPYCHRSTYPKPDVPTRRSTRRFAGGIVLRARGVLRRPSSTLLRDGEWLCGVAAHPTNDGTGRRTVSMNTFAFPVRLSEKYRPRKVVDFCRQCRKRSGCSPSLRRILTLVVPFLRPSGCREDFDGPCYGGRDGRRIVSPFGLAKVQPVENLADILLESARTSRWPNCWNAYFVLIDEVDSAYQKSGAARATLETRFTDAPKGHRVRVYLQFERTGCSLASCPAVCRLTSVPTVAGEIAAHLDQVWHAEGGTATAPTLPAQQGMPQQCLRLSRTAGSGTDGPVRHMGRG